MMGARPRSIAALAQDSRGASLVELALLAPILALMLMGISDIAMGFSAKMTLQQAAARALERAAVGSVRSDYQHLGDDAAAAAGVPRSAVTVTNWLECDQVRQESFDGTCGSEQMVSRYVQIEIAWGYEPTFRYGPIARAVGAGDDNRIPIDAHAALRIQ
jgi:Flp pilus assembly protein TadG